MEIQNLGIKGAFKYAHLGDVIYRDGDPREFMVGPARDGTPVLFFCGDYEAVEACGFEDCRLTLEDLSAEDWIAASSPVSV